MMDGHLLVWVYVFFLSSVGILLAFVLYIIRKSNSWETCNFRPIMILLYAMFLAETWSLQQCTDISYPGGVCNFVLHTFPQPMVVYYIPLERGIAGTPTCEISELYLLTFACEIHC